MLPGMSHIGLLGTLTWYCETSCFSSYQTLIPLECAPKLALPVFVLRPSGEDGISAGILVDLSVVVRLSLSLNSSSTLSKEISVIAFSSSSSSSSSSLELFWFKTRAEKWSHYYPVNSAGCHRWCSDLTARWSSNSTLCSGFRNWVWCCDLSCATGFFHSFFLRVLQVSFLR